MDWLRFRIFSEFLRIATIDREKGDAAILMIAFT